MHITLKNLTKPNFLPWEDLFLATNTSATFPSLEKASLSLATAQCSGKFVKKKVVAVPPIESSLSGEYLRTSLFTRGCLLNTRTRTRLRPRTTDHGPRTESDIKLSYQTPRTTDRVRHHRQILGLRFLYTDRVRGKTSDHRPSLTSKPCYQTLGPRTESVVCSPSPSPKINIPCCKVVLALAFTTLKTSRSSLVSFCFNGCDQENDTSEIENPNHKQNLSTQNRASRVVNLLYIII
ncbi:hypothetical protein LXL04_030403 [Taraxacum kok-saghyz]